MGEFIPYIFILYIIMTVLSAVLKRVQGPSLPPPRKEPRPEEEEWMSDLPGPRPASHSPRPPVNAEDPSPVSRSGPSTADSSPSTPPVGGPVALPGPFDWEELWPPMRTEPQGTREPYSPADRAEYGEGTIDERSMSEKDFDDRTVDHGTIDERMADQRTLDDTDRIWREPLSDLSSDDDEMDEDFDELDDDTERVEPSPQTAAGLATKRARIEAALGGPLTPSRVRQGVLLSELIGPPRAFKRHTPLPWRRR